MRSGPPGSSQVSARLAAQCQPVPLEFQLGPNAFRLGATESCVRFSDRNKFIPGFLGGEMCWRQSKRGSHFCRIRTLSQASFKDSAQQQPNPLYTTATQTSLNNNNNPHALQKTTTTQTA